MKGREFSHDELDRVIRLHQSGASWLRIQKETGIPRRAAKRVYEKWERSRSFDDLKEVRKAVAAEEFREHLYSLTQLAECLVAHLSRPATPYEVRDADAVLDELWRQDIREQLRPYAGAGDSDTKRQQILRQNHMLFKSLQDHTAGKVPWEALEEWKRIWNSCVKALAQLRTEANELLSGFLNRMPDLKQRVEKATGKEDALERLVDGALWVAWQRWAGAKLEEECCLMPIETEGQRTMLLKFGEGGRALEFRSGENDVAKEAISVCDQIIRDLSQGDTISRVLEEFPKMQAKVSELEERVDPLILRPMIIRTRCDLCPV